MKQDELVKRVAEKEGITQKKAKSVVKSVFETLSEVLSEGDQILIPSFARFSVVHRKGRVGTNLSNGEKVEIAPRKAVKFSPTQNLKDQVANS